MSRNLVAYFSASGVTAELAKKLAKAADADLYEIKPEIPYTKADLDWKDNQSRSSAEMRNPSSRPSLADKDADIAAYDAVFVGFPIWWHTAPSVIRTFLESYDFSGKTIVLFATSGSSGFGRTLEDMKPSVSDTVTWKEGKVLNGNPSEASLAAWTESLHL